MKKNPVSPYLLNLGGEDSGFAAEIAEKSPENRSRNPSDFLGSGTEIAAFPRFQIAAFSGRSGAYKEGLQREWFLCWDSPNPRQGPKSPCPGNEGFGILKPPFPLVLDKRVFCVKQKIGDLRTIEDKYLKPHFAKPPFRLARLIRSQQLTVLAVAKYRRQVETCRKPSRLSSEIY